MNALISSPLMLLWLVCCCLLPCSAFAETIRGTISVVQDGDSVIVRDTRQVDTRVRLFGVDAPEKGQPYGNAARSFSRRKALHQPVVVHVKRRDHYGRVIGLVELKNGSTLQEELLQEGLAWVYRRYTDRPDFLAAEERARRNQRGLWSSPNPVPPWQFRRNNNIGYKAGSTRKGRRSSTEGPTANQQASEQERKRTGTPPAAADERGILEKIAELLRAFGNSL